MSDEPPPTAEPTPQTNDQMAPGKRRPIPPAIPSIDPHLRSKPTTTETRSSRRKRLLLYSIAFFTMLGLSAVLDVRREAIRERRPKLQLTLPSGTSLSSVSDQQTNSEPRTPQTNDPSLSLRPYDPPHRPLTNTRPVSPPAPPIQLPTAQPPLSQEQELPKKDPVLSDQELKDDVDQFIAHVDELAAADASKSAALNATDSAPISPTLDDVHNSTEGAPVEPLAPESKPTPTNSTDGPLNSEDHFTSAQTRVKALLDNEVSKKYVDENDLRTLEALALQATRGDCEQKTGAAGGSLFKTDAEAASNVDIERTDPLWGAWCLFMGSYKTDAMRDYVTKQRVLEEKVDEARLVASLNSSTTAVSPLFDPNAPSLDDVLTPEQQSDLRFQTDRIMDHLREYDIRYLAALSLQATFGDCGPYGQEVLAQPTDGEEKKRLRILREPLLEQTVIRREGAQWGAWCVLQGKERTAAATELSQRLDLLIEQLAKSQSVPEVAVEEGTDIKEQSKSIITTESSIVV